MLNNVIILKNVTHDDASDINKDNVKCAAYTELELWWEEGDAARLWPTVSQREKSHLVDEIGIILQIQIQFK